MFGNKVGVFADPSKSGFFPQGFFQHRGAIGKNPVAELTDFLLYFIGQSL